ncbi:MAG: tetratricopeptide repeat protein, partial [Elusimicrobia bacterium]|nr:tetratricopeptide repeat protein [Elusimicrobiota bacterium]
LEGNAAKKARECARACGLWSLADDTGLEVAALGGAPGVRSARYAGEDCDFSANNAKLLEALRSKPSRAARFRTVMALCGPSGEPALEEGVLEGEIAEACRGANGFGYDPLFLIPELGLTLAQLEPERKNALSHRGKALRAIVPRILRAFALCALLLLAVRPAGATRTEPGERTIWDEIMASQAQRELRLGAQYLDEKQYEAALDELRRAVAANPQDPQAQMMLGVAYYWTGDVDRSIESYRKSVELAPQDAQPYMLLGISLAYKERIAQAYAAFKKAAELDSSRADIQMNLGSIEESMNRALDALEHFRRAVELAPHEALYHYQLGMLYRRLGRDADAADSLRRAIKDFPEFEDALLALGSVEERSGERAAAIRDFGKAVALKSRDSVARFRLARLLLEDGRLRQARAVLADAFHLTPEEGGAGLQLSISYAGGRSAAKAPAKSAPPQEEREAPADGPLSVFRRNLERVPLDQGALMQVDVLFVPKAELVRGGPGESSLSRALKRQLGQDLQVRAVRRQFHINPGSSLERQRQID